MEEGQGVKKTNLAYIKDQPVIFGQKSPTLNEKLQNSQQKFKDSKIYLQRFLSPMFCILDPNFMFLA